MPEATGMFSNKFEHLFSHTAESCVNRIRAGSLFSWKEDCYKITMPHVISIGSLIALITNSSSPCQQRAAWHEPQIFAVRCMSCTALAYFRKAWLWMLPSYVEITPSLFFKYIFNKSEKQMTFQVPHPISSFAVEKQRATGVECSPREQRS